MVAMSRAATDSRPSSGRRVQRQPLQAGPGHHAQVLGPPASQVVDVTDELRYRVGTQPDGGEKLRGIGCDDAAEQRFLVAEVGVQPLFAGVRGSGNAVDSRAGQPVLGELGPRGAQDRVAEFVVDRTVRSYLPYELVRLVL